MTTHPDTESLLLPEGTRLVHIGPPKTGTTSLQRAFHGGRDAVRRQGVHYVGPTHQPVGPVLAVTGRTSPISGKPPSRWTWRLLVNEVRRAKEPRVVLSSEFLADARPDAIRTIVGDLGADQVHVVVTLRPLARIVPSQWQQFVQSGLRQGYDDWLEVMFNGPPPDPTPTFWFRHHHDELVARWADVVGADNVTVVALDDANHAMVLRVFERLVGLREGTLVADRDVSNRSMTMPEIEVVRAFNELAVAEGLSGPLQTKVMRLGAAAYMKTREPEPDEPRIETPQWALDRAGEIAVGMVERIRASGVRIVGDLDGFDRGAAEQPRRDRAAAAGHPACRRRIGRGRCRARKRSCARRSGQDPGHARCPRRARPRSARLRSAPVGRAAGARPAVHRAARRRAAATRPLGDRQAAQCRGPTPPVIASATDTALLVPEGTRLVHIGPFKTGTTSLQAAFHAGRAAMHEQGVHYTGPNAQPVGPVMAATGRAHVMFGEPPPIKAWRRLVREVEEAPEPRVVVSSEFFSDAPSEAIRRIVNDLDPSRVHIAVTLRPLARNHPIAVAAVRPGRNADRVRRLAADDPRRPADGSPSLFWQRHRHDQLIARWADVVGTGT